jgi:DNA-binding NarL/FixJ family response regulator
MRTLDDDTAAIRVLIVSAHPHSREGLQRTLLKTPGIVITGLADTETAATELALETQPDIVILDTVRTGQTGLESLPAYHEATDPPRMLLIAIDDEHLYAQRAHDLGAHGYLLRQSPTTELATAIKALAHGDRYTDPNVTGQPRNL